MKYCLGIDPGATGAVAWMSEDLQDYGAMRWKEDIASTAQMFKDRILAQDLVIVLAVLEKVHSMPKQGVVSSFKFGSNFGAWQAMLAMAGIPFVLITPQKWQKATWDSDRKGKTTKQMSVSMVQRMFPEMNLTPGRTRVEHSGIADAALMAWYGIKVLKEGI